MNDPKLNYFKQKFIEHLEKLERQEKEEKTEVKKSLLEAEFMAKGGRGLPVGTIRDWKGKKYKKMDAHKWVRVYDKEDSSARRSIGQIKAMVDACEKCENLLQIAIKYKDRFSDENGRPLPIVEELSAYIAKRNADILMAEKETERRKTDNAKYSVNELDSYYKGEVQILKKINKELEGAKRTGNRKTIKQLKAQKKKHEKYRDEYKEELNRKQEEERRAKKEKIAAEKKVELTTPKEEEKKSEVSKVLEEYASDKKMKSYVDKISEDKIVSDDPDKKSMCGTYQDNGYRIATDGRVLTMIKTDYPQEEEKKIKASEQYLKELDKIIKNKESNLAKIINQYGVSSAHYERMQDDLNKVKEIKNTGYIPEKFPDYMRVIPDDADLKPVLEFEDIDKVMKIAKLAQECNKKYKKRKGYSQFAAVKIGERFFSPDYLLPVLAMAKKHGLTKALGNDNVFEAVKFSGENGCAMIMPVGNSRGDIEDYFDVTGAVNLSNEEIKKEFLSNGDDESIKTKHKNKDKYYRDFFTGPMTYALNKVETAGGVPTHKLTFNTIFEISNATPITRDNGVEFFERQREAFKDKYGENRGNKMIDTFIAMSKVYNEIIDRKGKEDEHSKEYKAFLKEKGDELKKLADEIPQPEKADVNKSLRLNLIVRKSMLSYLTEKFEKSV